MEGWKDGREEEKVRMTKREETGEGQGLGRSGECDGDLLSSLLSWGWRRLWGNS